MLLLKIRLVMVKYSFVFLILFILGMLCHILSPELATSVIPGWHMTIYPPWFSVIIFQVVWLGICAGIYFLIERKGRKINHNLFLVHVFLSLFLFLQNMYLYFDNPALVNIVAIAPYILYFIGQCVFIYSIVRTFISST